MDAEDVRENIERIVYLCTLNNQLPVGFASSPSIWKKLHENSEQHGLTREVIFRILETGFEQKADDFTQALLKFIDV